MRERLVVVGNGMVGLRFVEEVTRRAADRFDVTVIGAEPTPAYNRVLLSAVLAGEVSEEECRFRDRRWYLANRVRLITGARATGIDTTEREVRIGGHGVVPFDRLVLATGSDPIRLPVPGMGLPGVITFRDLADLGLMREAAARKAPAVVIGGGLLGLEAAYGLARAGVPVTLVHLAERVMERQLDDGAARIVEAAMREKGIEIVLAAQTAAVEGGERVEAVRLAGGRTIPAALVVVAVGVRPATELAATAGLAVERGIVVDDALATSVPGIHAIGECISHRGTVYGLVEPGYAQAAVLARRLAGEDARYEGTLLSTRLKVSGVPVFSAGDVMPPAGAEVITLSDSCTGRYARLVVNDERLVGAILVGETRHAGFYLDLIASGAEVNAMRDDLVFGPPVAVASPVPAVAAAA
ncbi:FAD-dependent oxidoreductase [Rhodoplanes sp. TEM]|uniref:FAD-dependent oxidoreductase n=1 Tax=Rhodoplanes tepidamans TaxID=200616 RepID=A0ABT5J5B8_RHOTP|nr:MULTISPECIES: FAD-dependent oxidoreductase [Rhodoplanes]MDC7784845.1 FAD-dependent oxidoreductase [Rhodoplanes tepidamans]MDC7982312.1 FAD-dependent oxidoreductase [Rhodoplanes sp. TEM]MDQ0356321.1 nitrite reductase (NADH) large subunit [Rhodoplanes tepidamans]